MNVPLVSGAKLGCFSPGRYLRNPRFQTMVHSSNTKLEHLSDKIMSFNAEIMGLDSNNKQKH